MGESSRRKRSGAEAPGVGLWTEWCVRPQEAQQPGLAQLPGVFADNIADGRALFDNAAAVVRGPLLTHGCCTGLLCVALF